MDLQVHLLIDMLNIKWLFVRPVYFRARLKACLLIAYNMAMLYIIHRLGQCMKPNGYVETFSNRFAWLLGMPTPPEFADRNGYFERINVCVNIFMFMALFKPNRCMGVYSLSCVFWNVVVCAKLEYYLIRILFYYMDKGPGLWLGMLAALNLLAPMLYMTLIVGALDFCDCCYHSHERE